MDAVETISVGTVFSVPLRPITSPPRRSPSMPWLRRQLLFLFFVFIILFEYTHLPWPFGRVSEHGDTGSADGSCWLQPAPQQLLRMKRVCLSCFQTDMDAASISTGSPHPISPHRLFSRLHRTPMMPQLLLFLFVFLQFFPIDTFTMAFVEESRNMEILGKGMCPAGCGQRRSSCCVWKEIVLFRFPN